MTYSSSLAVGRHRLSTRHATGNSARSWGKNQNRTTFRETDAKIGPISNTIMLVILACLLGLLYLTQVTKTNSYSYRINELQQQAEQLKDERAELEVTAARMQAVERTKTSAAARGFVSVAPTATIQD